MRLLRKTDTAGRTTWVVGLVFIIVFASVMVANAWVVDDAYITFRTVDNFINGHGLRWNVDERVQAYTHPLWMLAMSLAHVVTREFFFTSIVLSLVLTLSAVMIAAWVATVGFQRHLWRVPLLLVALLACKAFVDYASSGLENPLSYLIVVMFCWVWWSDERGISVTPERRLRWLLLLASLLFLNHADLVLVCLPALVAASFAVRHRGLRPLLSTTVVGTAPVTAWLVFSVVYYGFPLPNTAYAKALTTGLPESWKVMRGWQYLASSLSWDSAAFVMLAIAALQAVFRRRWETVLLVSGVLLHMTFVVVSGASATHMGGRFFAVSLFLSVILFVESIDRVGLGVAAGLGLALVLVLSPVSPFKFGTTAYKRVTRSSSMIDTKLYAFQEGAALLNWRAGLQMPDSAWLHAGEQTSKQPGKVIVGGAPGSDAIGYFGFGAGPHKFIVDRLGLTDPLLARLPALRPASAAGWKSGHFQRVIPEGYVESVAQDGNVLLDPGLREYYGAIRRVTRGAVWKWQRFKDIWDLNLGRYRRGPGTI